jgi:hypothetical protein
MESSPSVPDKVWASIKTFLQSQRHRKGAIIWLTSAVIIGEVLLPMIPISWKTTAVFCILALLLLEFVPWRYLLHQDAVTQKVIAVVLTLFITVPITWFGWNPLYNYLNSLQVTSVTSFIEQTSVGPKTNFMYDIYRYETTFEFGTTTTEVPIAVDMELDNGWDTSTVSGWFDAPGQKKPTKDSAPISSVELKIGLIRMTGIEPKIVNAPPKFSLVFDDNIKVTNQKSMYISFQSNDPLSVKDITFAGIHFLPKGNHLVPDIR